MGVRKLLANPGDNLRKDIQKGWLSFAFIHLRKSVSRFFELAL
jgi:hypothetical protein